MNECRGMIRELVKKAKKCQYEGVIVPAALY